MRLVRTDVRPESRRLVQDRLQSPPEPISELTAEKSSGVPVIGLKRVDLAN